jgi:hypothetical protein
MCVCWLLLSFSNHCEGTKFDDGPNLFWFEIVFYFVIFCNSRSCKNVIYRIVAELAVFNILSTCNVADAWFPFRVADSKKHYTHLCSYNMVQLQHNVCAESFKLLGPLCLNELNEMNEVKYCNS